MLTLSPASPDDIKQDGYYGNYQQHVDEATGTVNKEPEDPPDNKDYGKDIQ